MHQFMGSKADQKEQPVKVTYDPSIIKRRPNHVTSKEEQTNESIGNSTANMSLAMSLGRDERIFKMVVEYDKGNLFTLSAVAKYFDISYATAKSYAKEAGIMIYDDHAKKYTEGRKPKSMS